MVNKVNPFVKEEKNIGLIIKNFVIHGEKIRKIFYDQKENYIHEIV